MEIELSDKLTDEEAAALELIAQKLGLTIAPRNTKSGEVKVYRCEVTCTLCKSVIVQYVALYKYRDGSWKKGDDVAEEFAVAHKAELYTTKVRSCGMCERVLIEKTKEELVKMVLNAYAPIVDGSASLKYELKVALR